MILKHFENVTTGNRLDLDVEAYVTPKLIWVEFARQVYPSLSWSMGLRQIIRRISKRYCIRFSFARLLE